MISPCSSIMPSGSSNPYNSLHVRNMDTHQIFIHGHGHRSQPPLCVAGMHMLGSQERVGACEPFVGGMHSVGLKHVPSSFKLLVVRHRCAGCARSIPPFLCPLCTCTTELGAASNPGETCRAFLTPSCARTPGWQPAKVHSAHGDGSVCGPSRQFERL